MKIDTKPTLLIVDENNGRPSVVLRGTNLRIALPEKRRRDSKRDALLAAAREEFAANGFLGTHVAVVATRVGIRKSTFFHYFDGKESLYDAAVGSVLSDVVDAVDGVALSSSFGERLDAIVECLQHHAEADANLPRLMLRSLIDGAPPGTPRPTPMDRLADRLVETVTLGVHEGRLPACDASTAALTIIGVLCLQRRGSTAPLEMRVSEPLIGATPSSRVAEMKAQVRHMLNVR